MAKEEKRGKILEAASECFARFGYDKTTLEDIGKAVNLNKASLYYYYKNKEDIFSDVIYKEADDFMAELHRRKRPGKTAEHKVMQYLGDRLEYYKSVVNLHNLSMDFVRKFEPFFNDLYQKILNREVEFISEILKEGIHTGEIRRCDTDKVGDAILTMATSIRYRELHISHIRLASDADYDRILEDIRYVAKLIINGIKVIAN